MSRGVGRRGMRVYRREGRRDGEVGADLEKRGAATTLAQQLSRASQVRWRPSPGL